MSNISSWNVSKGHVELTEQDVHVWKAWLGVPVAVIHQYQELLSTEEQTS